MSRNSKFSNPHAIALIERYQPIWAVSKAMELSGWDLETFMPPKGSFARGNMTGQLTALIQKMYSDPHLLDLLDRLQESQDLTPYEKGLARVMRRETKVYTKVPAKLMQELSELTTRASLNWRTAREKNNYEIFKSDLGKIIELTRDMADHLGYEVHPYNALLDLHEEGFTVQDADEVFGELRDPLKVILEKAATERDSPLALETYDQGSMKMAEIELLTKLGYDFTRFREDTSAHPFTVGISIGDVRITTRRKGYDFKDTLFSVLHEGGHALYELQIDPELEFTPLSGGASMGIHESQSRFMENMIGRSREFARGSFEILSKYLPFLRNYSEEEIYSYFNHVKPGLIRVEADEVSYNFHIMIRYEVEKQLIGGQAQVSDLPELWSELYKKYLGVRPNNFSDGVLQDIHWSGGSFGYFPSYTIGNVVAAQIRYHAMRDIPDMYAKVSDLDIAELKQWLKEKVHVWGATYTPKELMMRSFGEGYQPKYLINYLREKYL
ncbi:MAG: carboxypeptidase M32 [Thermoprotei archaeon]|nr:carboxypeptidase M32 [TACK group archaeon]